MVRVQPVEETYKKVTQLEHILLRPDTYIGSTELTQHQIFTLSNDRIALNTVSYPPGLYKIFDEILSNAADNKVRDPQMTTIKVSINSAKNSISVYNDGKGIPVTIHKEHHIYVPELIFGNLLTSSNYDDKVAKTTGGRNGYGAKLCNIFSKSFIIETQSEEDQLTFKQVYKNNMSKMEEAIIKPISTSKSKVDFTKITFIPDLEKFGMTEFTEDLVSVLSKRVYDIAGTTRGVKVYLNDKMLKIKSFADYVKLYITPGTKEDEEGNVVIVPLNKSTMPSEKNERWEIICVPSEGQFQQVSFVNSICTIKGGTHVNYVTDQIVQKITENLKKQSKEAGLIKTFNIKQQIFIFINCLIENPSFDSQTKETMTLKASKFGSKCQIGDDFMKKLLKSEIIQNLMSLIKNKEEKQLKKTDGTKRNLISGISKLDDANFAGTKKGKYCTLILTEGDSAKALAVCGLSVVGRDNYGVFPLRGKMLNVRECSSAQVMKNEEITNIKRILGLQQQKIYQDISSLRYGHVMIMADQDHDGSHIKAGREVSFYTMPEYETWAEENENGRGWTIKYYKGLGTSTAADAKKYFQNMKRHVRPFKTCNPEDRDLLKMAFSKKSANERKDWLSEYQSGTFIDTKLSQISVSDFVNKELIVHSIADNIRSLPSVIDGLKPGHRKILFACIKRNLVKGELKVAQLAGYVSEHSAYHHGENSLAQTIVNLAMNHTGSNNINLLEPIGQFGTRLQGGKDHAAPRYIFTRLSNIARKIFHPLDDALVKYRNEEGMSIEPDYYIPIIPMALINGVEGIGTGWSTNILNYNPKDLIENMQRKINGQEFLEMMPWYNGFKGTIEKNGKGKYLINGVYEVKNSTTIEITELPIGVWTQTYKEFLEELLVGTEKVQPFIKEFKEYHTDVKVHFKITLDAQALADLQTEPNGIVKKFKLQSSKASTNMVLFNQEEKLTKYETVIEIMEEFFAVRYDFYVKRKEWLEKTLKAELENLDNKVRFLGEVINGTLVIQNKRKPQIESMLKEKGYAEYSKKNKGEASASSTAAEEETGGGYSYLLSMSLWSLTIEKMEKLTKERDGKLLELRELEAQTPSDLWDTDLFDLLQEWEADSAEKSIETLASSKTKNPTASRGIQFNKQKRVSSIESDDDDFQSSSTSKKVKLSVDKPIVKRKPPSAPVIKPIKNSILDSFFKYGGQNSSSMDTTPIEIDSSLLVVSSNAGGLSNARKAKRNSSEKSQKLRSSVAKEWGSSSNSSSEDGGFDGGGDSSESDEGEKKMIVSTSTPRSQPQRGSVKASSHKKSVIVYDLCSDDSDNNNDVMNIDDDGDDIVETVLVTDDPILVKDKGKGIDRRSKSKEPKKKVELGSFLNLSDDEANGGFVDHDDEDLIQSIFSDEKEITQNNKKRRIVSSDDDDDNHVEEPPTASQYTSKKRRVTGRRSKSIDDDDDESDFASKELSKSSRSSIEKFSLSSSESQDVVKNSTIKNSQKTKKKVLAISSESENEDVEVIPVVKKSTRKPTKKEIELSESEDDDEVVKKKPNRNSIKNKTPYKSPLKTNGIKQNLISKAAEASSLTASKLSSKVNKKSSIDLSSFRCSTATPQKPSKKTINSSPYIINSSPVKKQVIDPFAFDEDEDFGGSSFGNNWQRSPKKK